MPEGMRVEGADELVAACARAVNEMAVTMQRALMDAAEPVRVEASRLSPRRSGTLAGGYRIVAAGGVQAAVENPVPYAAGAEYGRFGKWSGFARYGPPGSRFAGKAVEDQGEAVVRAVMEGLRDMISIFGWARDG